MKTKKVLLVGGTNDGLTLLIDSGLFTLEIPEVEVRVRGLIGGPLGMFLETETYYSHELVVGGKFRAGVFLHGSIRHDYDAAYAATFKALFDAVLGERVA